MNREYEAWNRAIAARYFSAHLAGRPAYLALDDDELADLAAAAQAPATGAAEHLSSSVRRELWAPGLFSGFQQARRVWRREGTEGRPPYLGLLGLCVLAGSRMARDPAAGIEPNAYYPQLNRLLGRAIDAGMPQGFDGLHLLWEDLNDWLERDQGGQLGRSTIRTHPFFRHIGWPLSQCLVRAADRHRFPDFFRSAGLEPGSEIAQQQLWVLLKNWAGAGSGLTEQGRRTIERASDHVAEQITAIAQRELAAWDGELRDRQGRRRGDIVILLDKLAGGRRVELRLAARHPDGFPEGSFQLPDGSQLELRTSPTTGWYAPLEVAPTGRILRDGLSLISHGHSLAYEPSKVIPFRQSLEVSAWLSARRATAVEEHAVLAHSSVLPELRGFLRRHARQGWRGFDVAGGNLPAGWAVIEHVHLDQAPDSVSADLRRLAPRLNTAAQLEGGLKVGRGLYLAGGEPDLVVTVEEGQRCEVEVDGHRSVLNPGVARVPLRGRTPGTHEVNAAGRLLRFRTVTTFGQIATRGTGTLGHVLERHGAYRPASQIAAPLPDTDPPRGSVYLRGAAPQAALEDLPRPDAPPVLLRAGFDRHELIGARPGELLQAHTPAAPPAWLRDVRDAEGRRLSGQWQFFDQPLLFTPEWILSWGHLGLSVHRAGDCSPGHLAPAGDASEAERAWAMALLNAQRALSADRCARQLRDAERATWEDYLTAARELLPEVRA